MTIAEVLKGAGYFTAMTGKWHLGQQHGCTPWSRGFERSLNSRFGEVYFPKESDKPGTENLYLDGKELSKDSPVFGMDWYSTDLFTEWGLKFVDEALAAKKPFFLYIAQGAVHFPLRAPAATIAKYRGRYLKGWDVLRDQRYAKQLSLGIIDPKWTLAPRPPEAVDADTPAAVRSRGERNAARNRLIAGWAKAVWVVEASCRSGALSTARWAREQDRDCYATPCFPGDLALEGNQKLIDRHHAIPFWRAHSLGQTWLELAARAPVQPRLLHEAEGSSILRPAAFRPRPESVPVELLQLIS